MCDGSRYSLYANGTNTAPIAGLQSNYSNAIGAPWNVGTGTQEQNGTFDMMGNVWEWNETLLYGSYPDVRGAYPVVRGGSFRYNLAGDGVLSSSYRSGDNIYDEYEEGFRVASVPEPCSLVLLSLGGLALLRKRRA